MQLKLQPEYDNRTLTFLHLPAILAIRSYEGDSQRLIPKDFRSAWTPIQRRGYVAKQ
jgi:hypothetical protein